MLQLKSELESSAKSQQDFAQLLRTQEGMLGDFSNKRDSARKTVSFPFPICPRERRRTLTQWIVSQQQASVEKLWKNVVNQRQHVLKVRLDSPALRGCRLLILQVVSTGQSQVPGRRHPDQRSACTGVAATRSGPRQGAGVSLFSNVGREMLTTESCCTGHHQARQSAADSHGQRARLPQLRHRSERDHGVRFRKLSSRAVTNRT